MGHNPTISLKPELPLCSNMCDDNIYGPKAIPLMCKGQFQDVHHYLRTSKNEPASFIRGDVTATLLLEKITIPFNNMIHTFQTLQSGEDFICR